MNDAAHVRKILSYAERLTKYDYVHYSEVKPAFTLATPALEKLLEPQELEDLALGIGMLTCAEELGLKTFSKKTLKFERNVITRMKEILNKYKSYYK